MEDAKWYFTHETEEDRLWYRIFFAMCRKFGVSWSKASEEQKAFIEGITRINYEREMAKRNLTRRCPLDPHRDPHGETSGRKQWNKQAATSSFLDKKTPQSLIQQGLEGSTVVGKDEVTSSNLVSSSKKHLKSSDFGCFSLQKCTFRCGSKCGSTA